MTPPAEIPPRGADRGLQAERTRLAWRRTALAGTAVALLSLRLAVMAGPAGVVLVPLTLAGWVAMLVVAFRRVRAMGPGRPPPVGRAVGLTALAVGYAGLGAVLVLATR